MMLRTAYAVYGLTCALVFAELGPYVLLLWLAGGSTLAFFMRADGLSLIAFPSLGCAAGLAAGALQVHIQCYESGCQTESVWADLFWSVIALASICVFGAASLALNRLRGRLH